MKKILLVMCALALSAIPSDGNAQTENPRGIYRMMTLVGKVGEIKSPFDQYKICTDSATLTFRM